MSQINWFEILNTDDWESGIVSKEIEYDFGALLGTKTVIVTKGNLFSILFEGYFICAELNDQNPTASENYLAFIDPDNGLWLGVLSED